MLFQALGLILGYILGGFFSSFFFFSPSLYLKTRSFFPSLMFVCMFPGSVCQILYSKYSHSLLSFIEDLGNVSDYCWLGLLIIAVYFGIR